MIKDTDDQKTGAQTSGVRPVALNDGELDAVIGGARSDWQREDGDGRSGGSDDDNDGAGGDLDIILWDIVG
jgi:hypothetical protein